MIFRFITGKLGMGKTLVSVGVAFEYLNRGSMVATNVDFYPEHFPKKRNNTTRIIRVPDHPKASDLQALGVGNPTLEKGPDGNWRPGKNYDPNKNSLLLLDELAQFMNSRNWNDKDRKNLISHLVLLRKLGWDAYFIVQHIEMIDKQIKEALASETGRCNKLSKFNVPVISPIWKLITGKPLKLPPWHVVTYRDGHSTDGIKTDQNMYMGKHLYNVYNTAQTYSAEYEHGVHSLLTPWHLVGRYLPQRLTLAQLLKLIASRAFIYGLALPAHVIYHSIIALTSKRSQA
jgi:hypothetical protein